MRLLPLLGAAVLSLSAGCKNPATGTVTQPTNLPPATPQPVVVARILGFRLDPVPPGQQVTGGVYSSQLDAVAQSKPLRAQITINEPGTWRLRVTIGDPATSPITVLESKDVTFTISAPMGVVDVSLNNNQPNGIVRVGVANLNSVSLSGLMNVYLQD